MRVILTYRDGRERVLRRRRGGVCPELDLEKEAAAGLFSLAVEAEGGEPVLIAFNWGNAKPPVHRNHYLAGGEVLRESLREREKDNER